MNSPPSKDNTEETVLVPGAMPRPTAPAERSSSGAGGGAPDSRFADTNSGDPHSPSLNTDSLAAGTQGQGNALPIGTYLGDDQIVSANTLHCFVGMIETGEANIEDFRQVGGDSLVRQVEAMQRALA